MANNTRPETMARITTPELAQAFIDEQLAQLRAQIGEKKVLLALSGGVDSSVVAALLIRAVGKQLTCVHVNHGLLRKGEPEQVIEVFRNQMNANLVYVDAVDRFLDKLAGVEEPERKRKIIGAEFIEDLQFELVEPLKFLYKDEVRVVGHELGLPDNMVYRQPFPGPGLGVRCVGAITRATGWRPCGSPTPSCGRNLPKTDWPARSGSTSPSCPTSSPPASPTASAPMPGPWSSVPSTPWTPLPPKWRSFPSPSCSTSPSVSPTR